MPQSNPKKRLFIFDFDGTIADTYHYIVAISNQLAKEFNYREISEQDIETLKDHTSREVIKILQVPMMKIPAIIARAKQELHKNLHHVHAIPDLKDTLQELHSRGIALAILSSNSEQNVRAFLKNHGMESFFEFVQTTSRVWSKDSSLKKIFQEYGLAAEDVVYIGDELRDVTAARKINVKVIAVSWGFNSFDALQALAPDFIIRQPRELLELIPRLQN